MSWPRPLLIHQPLMEVAPDTLTTTPTQRLPLLTADTLNSRKDKVCDCYSRTIFFRFCRFFCALILCACSPIASSHTGFKMSNPVLGMALFRSTVSPNILDRSPNFVLLYYAALSSHCWYLSAPQSFKLLLVCSCTYFPIFMSIYDIVALS